MWDDGYSSGVKTCEMNGSHNTISNIVLEWIRKKWYLKKGLKERVIIDSTYVGMRRTLIEGKQKHARKGKESGG